MWFPKHGIAIRRIASRDKKARRKPGFFIIWNRAIDGFMLSWALYHEKAFSDFCSLLSIGAAGSIGKTGVQIYDQLERRCHFCGRATIASGMQNLRDFCKPAQRSTEQCDSKCLSGSPCRSWRFSWQHSWNYPRCKRHYGFECHTGGWWNPGILHFYAPFFITPSEKSLRSEKTSCGWGFIYRRLYDDAMDLFACRGRVWIFVWIIFWMERNLSAGVLKSLWMRSEIRTCRFSRKNLSGNFLLKNLLSKKLSYRRAEKNL